jgi:hypothetical protein
VWMRSMKDILHPCLPPVGGIWISWTHNWQKDQVRQGGYDLTF